MPEPIRIDVTPSERVTAIVYPAVAGIRVGVSLILAHGAGANQTSAFMVRFASALAARGIDTVTFNFLYSEARRRVPDKNDKLEACWRKVIEAWRDGKFGKRATADKLFIGGKSMGGRIASQVAASIAFSGEVDTRFAVENASTQRASSDIAGLVLLGYPLHPPGQPDKLRTKHLPAIRAPMLVVQGSRDAFGTPDELRPILDRLTAPAELYVVEGGDHSYKVAKKAVPNQEQVHELVLDEVERWLRRHVSNSQR
jgi:predicted alpha/beta-hydrolase family hydrolase